MVEIILTTELSMLREADKRHFLNAYERRKREFSHRNDEKSFYYVWKFCDYILATKILISYLGKHFHPSKKYLSWYKSKFD